MKLIIFLFVSGLFYLFAAPVSANNFGALAYDRQSNAYGVAWDMPSQAAANSRALAECAKNSRNCAVVVQFANQCAAYATGQGNIWGYGTGGSRAVAEQFANNYCSQNGKGCQIRVWGCTARPGSGQQAGIIRHRARLTAMPIAGTPKKIAAGAGRNNTNALAARAGAVDWAR